VALVSASDVQARLSSQAYARLFAKSGGATVDSTFLALCVAEAESQVRIWSQGHFPAGFDAAGGTVDTAIVGACVDVACYLAARRHPSAQEGEAYRRGFDDAREFFRALNRDRDARPVTSAAGRAQPRGTTNNTTDEAGDYTNPWSRVADRRDSSDY